MTEAYGYNALGNRTAKSVDGTAVASCQYNGMNQLVPEPELPETALSETALPGKPYFQPDINGLGGVLQYTGSDVWGRRKEQEESGGSGFQGQPKFTSYSFDPIIGKYFAQARFYDAEQGRMMGKDPVKRGLNAYPYCDNDPVNYVDPTGEISNIVAGGAANGAVVGAVR